jgi:hypothetical protein
VGRLRRPCAQDGRERCDFAVGEMVVRQRNREAQPDGISAPASTRVASADR